METAEVTQALQAADLTEVDELLAVLAAIIARLLDDDDDRHAIQTQDAQSGSGR